MMHYLGQIDFEQARKRQLELVFKRQNGQIADTILFCEHPPTLSLGPRTTPADLVFSEAEIVRRGIKIVRADRGGSVTYHGPGQLVCYPVVSLREGGIGVRGFVYAGLLAIQAVAHEYKIPAEIKLNPAGLWVDRRKLAAVGLRIRKGVSDHGFSLNLRNMQALAQLIIPCGIRGVFSTSFEEEVGIKVKAEEICLRLGGHLLRSLDNCRHSARSQRVLMDNEQFVF